VIDTLKLSRKLQEAKMPQEQADALAEGLHESVKDSYVTNEKLDVALAKLRTELILWIVGTVGLGVIVNHFWRCNESALHARR
jgi:hypothetical protein